MKKLLNWRVVLGSCLLLLSFGFYGLHYLIFRDLHHIFLYLIGDLAFLFLDIFIVILFLEGLLNYREKKAILNKLNMVIGTFFIELGTDLLKKCIRFDENVAKLEENLVISNDWTEEQCASNRKNAEQYQSKINSKNGNLDELKLFLINKRSFLLSLLENATLLEHESFTNLLWAVFHLTDELANRYSLENLPETDYQHLANDINRVYLLLIQQWIAYMKHLKQDYPYLFSLAIRKNPFDDTCSVVVG